jgi:hypothetical protein
MCPIGRTVIVLLLDAHTIVLAQIKGIHVTGLRISIIAIIAIANGFALPSSALTQPTDVGRFPVFFRGSCRARNGWKGTCAASSSIQRGAGAELVRINDLRSLLLLLCGAAGYI